jgi:RNA polymerase sigma-70 factor (ECF subfamily)
MQFENYDGIKLFLFTITKNACISYIRSQTAQQNYIGNMQAAAVIEDEKFFDELDYQANLLERVYQEVDKLPKQCRKVFQLKFYNNCSHQQIAQRLNLSESAVRAHIANAIQKIRIVVRHKEMLLLFLSLYFF